MRHGWVVATACLILVILAVAAQDRSGLRSRRDAERLLPRLGVQWDRPGPPVVIIFGPGCGDCALLQDLLTGEGIQVALPAPGVETRVGLVEEDEVGAACQDLGQVDHTTREHEVPVRTFQPVRFPTPAVTRYLIH